MSRDPITPPRPDLPYIPIPLQVMLYSEGFAHAKALAVKLVAIFSLSKQLLSPQQHYDWGLRALKTVLRVGGQLVAAEKKTRGGAALDEAEEAMLVIKVTPPRHSRIVPRHSHSGPNPAFPTSLTPLLPSARDQGAARQHAVEADARRHRRVQRARGRRLPRRRPAGRRVRRARGGAEGGDGPSGGPATRPRISRPTSPSSIHR